MHLSQASVEKAKVTGCAKEMGFSLGAGPGGPPIGALSIESSQHYPPL